MATEQSEKFTRYQLRRTFFPWKFREVIDEVLDFSKRYGVEEVIWKIDTEEVAHGLPTLDRIAGYLPALKESRQRLAEAGIAMSINPWVTQGMRDAGWDLRGTFPDFEWLTDITGVQAKSQACPAGPAWRKWLMDAYDMYASTGPRVLWLEDDFRVHRHRPVTVACFCQRHVQGFSKKMGRPFTRESLAAEILKPGEPSPIRARWFDYVGGIMCEVVEMLAERVYGKYPQVRLGLMCNSPEMSASERRNWDRLMKALAGPHDRVTIRPPMGNYSESNLRGLFVARDMIAGTLKCIRRPAHACTELENYPYTRYAKSMRMTRAQLLQSAAARCPSITMNLFDHSGTPLAADEGFGKVLADVRPMLDQVVETFAPDGVEKGVGILMPENGSDSVHLKPGDKFPKLILPREAWAELLQSLGTSVTWSNSPVIAVSGQRLRAYREKLDDFFAGGVLLDAAAVETLKDMVGPARLRELTGVTLNTIFERRERITSLELMIDPGFGGPAGKNDPANAGAKTPAKHTQVDHAGLLTRVADMTVHSQARVISKLANADLEPMLPGFTLFENSLGGRVAVCPYVLEETAEDCPWLLNPHRARQLELVVDWLFRGKTPLHVEGGVYGLPIRTDYADHVSAAVLNLSLDAWETVKLRLSMEQSPRSVRRLQHDGQWQEISSFKWDAATKCLLIDSASPIDCGDLAVFRIV